MLPAFKALLGDLVMCRRRSGYTDGIDPIVLQYIGVVGGGVNPRSRRRDVDKL